MQTRPGFELLLNPFHEYDNRYATCALNTRFLCNCKDNGEDLLEISNDQFSC